MPKATETTLLECKGSLSSSPLQFSAEHRSLPLHATLIDYELLASIHHPLGLQTALRTLLILRLFVLRLIWPAHCHFRLLIRREVMYTIQIFFETAVADQYLTYVINRQVGTGKSTLLGNCRQGFYFLVISKFQEAEDLAQKFILTLIKNNI